MLAVGFLSNQKIQVAISLQINTIEIDCSYEKKNILLFFFSFYFVTLHSFENQCEFHKQ